MNAQYCCRMGSGRRPGEQELFRDDVGRDDSPAGLSELLALQQQHQQWQYVENDQTFVCSRASNTRAGAKINKKQSIILVYKKLLNSLPRSSSDPPKMVLKHYFCLNDALDSFQHRYLAPQCPEMMPKYYFCLHKGPQLTSTPKKWFCFFSSNFSFFIKSNVFIHFFPPHNL